jgi:hypothetical protein
VIVTDADGFGKSLRGKEKPKERQRFDLMEAQPTDKKPANCFQSAG